MQFPQSKKPFIVLFLGISFVVVAAILWLLIPVPVEAQCGSQASSCKDCHEIQAQLPVNKDGTGWHESHAFGDFCTFCHAGNQQAIDKVESHTGLVPPLSDVKAACQSCHTTDTQQRAQIYAAILKVDLNQSGATVVAATPTNVPTQGAVPATAQPAASAEQAAVIVPISPEMIVNDPNVTDYVQRYNEIVLGERPTNWGNIILVALIGLLVVGGGGFVIFNEIRVSQVTKKVEGEYPAEVVDMLPDLAALKPQSRISLRNILKHRQKTDRVLGAIDSLVSNEKTEE